MTRFSPTRWLLTLLAALSFPIAAHAGVPNIPTVEGPTRGPEPMHPGMRPGPEGTNPQDFDYVVGEYFVSGTAGPTGAGYKARLLVRRPANPEKFSGVVLYGVVPPRAQPIGFDDTTANHGSRLALDGQGNVQGGVPSPYVDVPVVQYGVPNAGATPAPDGAGT